MSEPTMTCRVGFSRTVDRPVAGMVVFTAIKMMLKRRKMS